MKFTNKEIILLFVCLTLAFIISVFVGGFIFWGLGNLIIYAFHLTYSWTFLQGLCISLIVSIIFPFPIKLKINATNNKEDNKEDNKENDETTVSKNTK